MATVSFLSSRASPAGGFWIALAGGVALARVAQRRGARQGYGASIAAMLETVALMGPARFGVPLTQAVTAPLLGRLVARGVGTLPQLLLCGAIRLLHNSATTAFFIWIITGGLDAYAGSYDALAGRVGIELGTADALLLTAAGLLAWTAFATPIQVAVYRRGLRRWAEGAEAGSELAEAGDEGVESGGEAGAAGCKAVASGGEAAEAGDDGVESGASRGEAVAALGGAIGARSRRFDARLVAAAAGVAFALLLGSTAWPLLAGVSVWLALASAVAGGDREPVPTGLALAALLAGGALLFTLGGGLGLELALRRSTRAALLVLVATWLRSAAGADGLREVSRRVLGRLRRLPSLPEAALTLDEIGSEGRLAAAARSLVQSLGRVPKRPMPVVDAVLDWVARESARYRTGRATAPRVLRARPADWILLALAAAPAAALPLS